MKCDACGAPIENNKCTYCGKVFYGFNSGEKSVVGNKVGKININKKKNNKGFVIIIFIVVCLLLSFCGIEDSRESDNNSIWAQGYTDIEEFNYYIDGEKLYIKEYKGNDRKVKINSEYTIDNKKYKVVELMDGTFALESIESAIIPEGVKKMENNTFNSCGVKYVYLPSTLKEISSSFLDYFHDVEKIYYGGSKKQWDKLVDEDREEIDVKQIIYDANLNELK